MKKDLSKKNYYELLGVERTATETEIKQAFKEISIVYHPDSNFFDEILPEELKESDDEVFKKITEAYQTLSNFDKRKEYDAELNKKEISEGINSTGEWIRPDGTTPGDKARVRERTPTVTNLQILQKQFNDKESDSNYSVNKTNSSLPISARVNSESQSVKEMLDEESGVLDKNFLMIILGIGVLLIIGIIVLIFI